MGYLVVVFAVWLIWNVLPQLFTTPTWFPYLVAVATGIAGAALVEASNWWWGIGLAGMAGFLLTLSDLALVTTDGIRSRVLARGPTRR
jgi:hypothetical protein